MRLALMMLLAYFAGSINFAIILLRLLRMEDPRTQFSGNAGTTNVFRQAGKVWAAVVLMLDAEGSSPAELVQRLQPARRGADAHHRKTQGGFRAARRRRSGTGSIRGLGRLGGRSLFLSHGWTPGGM